MVCSEQSKLITFCNIIVIDFNKNGGTIFVGREDCLTIFKYNILCLILDIST